MWALVGMGGGSGAGSAQKGCTKGVRKRSVCMCVGGGGALTLISSNWHRASNELLPGAVQLLLDFFLVHRSYSISFRGAQGIPKYNTGFGRGKGWEIVWGCDWALMYLCVFVCVYVCVCACVCVCVTCR